MEERLARIENVLLQIKESQGEMRSDVRGMRDTITERGTRLDGLTSRVVALEVHRGTDTGRRAISAYITTTIVSGISSILTALAVSSLRGYG